jgi:glycerol kinase
VVWQCRRSAPICNQLKKDGREEEIHHRTGLVCDAYFSASKIRWLLENDPEIEKRARRGKLLFGTVDSWLLYKLTEGKVHATDVSNASRTMLFNIHDLVWDEEILRWLHVPPEILPEVLPSSHWFGATGPQLFTGAEIPICGVAGDQQAALFGQACFQPGMVKTTYGTGSFLLMNTGRKPVRSKRGMLTTVAWSLGTDVTYCLEGSIFISGAVIQWLRDELEAIASAEESENLARTVTDNGGVYFVPAFVGLGAPHWDMNARGLLIGLTRGSSKAHIARAALESIAYQNRDVIDCMKQDADLDLRELRVDGGGSRNDLLVQFQSDILDAPVVRAKTPETTALGAAYLAGLAAGYWRDLGEIESTWEAGKRCIPQMDDNTRKRLYGNWQRAVERARGWIQEDGM